MSALRTSGQRQAPSSAEAPRELLRVSQAWSDTRFREYARSGDLRIRNELVLAHSRLAYYFAQRFARGSRATCEDLVQVGMLGLISAVERFNPERGFSFTAFACPTIAGVIKRYLRDQTWGVKVPRRLRELGITLRRTRDEMEARLGRCPTIPEIALETGCSEEKVLEALELQRLYQPASFDTLVRDDLEQDGGSGWEAVGEDDARLTAVQDKEALRAAIERLETRDRHIIRRRFFCQASQAQIADELGISQMHVSRLERQALQELRSLLE